MKDADTLAAKLGIERPNSAPLIFPEVWDVATARVLVEAGYPILGTSASAYAWAQGFRPGERVGLEELLIMAGRIVRDTGTPLIADLEGCFDRSHDAVRKAVFAALSIGATGVFLGDGGRDGMHQMLGVMEVANRIKTARMAAMEAKKDLFLVARTDALPLAAIIANPFEEAIRRARSYLDAGADLVHITGVQNPEVVANLVREVGGPVAISITHRGAPGMAVYHSIGVAALSLGTGLLRSALADLERKAITLQQTGEFTHLDGAVSDNEMASLFTAAPQKAPKRLRA